jgi:hypothetical protein
VRIVAEVTDPDPGDEVAQIDLFRGITGTTTAIKVAGSIGNAAFSWRDLNPPAVGSEAHYYLRIRMADNQSIWTGPVYVAYEAASPVAVEGRPSSRDGLTLAAHPNPSPAGLTVEFTLPRDADRASLAIYDLAGRRQRTLLTGPLAAGPHTLTWDGRAENGERPGSGIFFLRLDTDAGRVEHKVLMLR